MFARCCSSSSSAFRPVSFQIEFCEGGLRNNNRSSRICKPTTKMKTSSKVKLLGIRHIPLSRPFSGALRWSVCNRIIWPMILSLCCYSLKLFSYSLDHQDKLAFMWSFSVICVSRHFHFLSAIWDMLFSSPRPFDLNLWALVFTIQKETDKKGGKTHCFQIVLCWPFFSDICVIITPLNVFVMLLLS